MPKLAHRRTIGIILIATAGLIFLLSYNWAILLLLAIGFYLYYKGGE